MEIKNISENQIEEFIENGYIVIPNVITQSEVEETNRQFLEFLKSQGFDPERPEETACYLAALSSTKGSGGILDVFYQDWKLKFNEDPRIVKILQKLWENTYAKEGMDTLFSHPYGKFDTSKAYMYIDRVCYRLPTSTSEKIKIKSKFPLQRQLYPHLDCCPHDMYSGNKWRPIQSFLCLSDTLNKNEGGFEACVGFHKYFDEWAKEIRPKHYEGTVPPCVGSFTPIRPKEDKQIFQNMTHIPCKAGDLVCWDVRIPHGNSQLNILNQARAVIYLGFLPAIELNRKYAENQLISFNNGVIPNDQWHSSTRKEHTLYSFSDLGKKMMTILSWE